MEGYARGTSSSSSRAAKHEKRGTKGREEGSLGRGEKVRGGEGSGGRWADLAIINIKREILLKIHFMKRNLQRTTEE